MNWVYYKSTMVFKFSRSRLRTYLHELMDIWNYRDNLVETKRKVEPQREIHFIILIFLILTKEKEQIQKNIKNYEIFLLNPEKQKMQGI